MEGRLIFSFIFSLDMAFDHTSLPITLIILFKNDFDLFKFMANTSTLSIILTEEIPMGFMPIL